MRADMKILGVSHRESDEGSSPRAEARRTESGEWGSWERGIETPPHQLVGLGQRCKKGPANRPFAFESNLESNLFNCKEYY